MNTPTGNKIEKYLLRSSDIDAMHRNAKYVYCNANIEQDKTMELVNKPHGKRVKIFTPELAYLFTECKIQYSHQSSKRVSYFDGTKFFDCYTEAYIKGEQDFDKDFKITNDTLYSKADPYVRDIHYNYFHANICGSFGAGWNHWRKSYPLLITQENIYEYGYYSGFIGKVWELATKYPSLFKDLDKCELSAHSTPVVISNAKLRVNQIALIHFYEEQPITRVNANDIALRHGYKSGEGLYHDYMYYSSAANRKGEPESPTKTKFRNKITLFESVVEKLTDKAKQRAIDELAILKIRFEKQFQ